MFLLSACAQSNGPYRYQSNAGIEPQRVAAAVPPRIAVDADGQQRTYPKILRRSPADDDPREPFSPNYGPPPAEPPVFERRAQFAPHEAEAIIAQAITEHELRTQ